MELQVAGEPGQTATKSHLNRNAAAHGTVLASNWGFRMLLGRSLHYKELVRADCRGAEPDGDFGSTGMQFPCCIQGIPHQHVSQPLHWLHEPGAQPSRTQSPNHLLQAQRHQAEARPQPTSPRTLPMVPPVTTSHSCKQIHIVTSSTPILQYKVIPLSSRCPGASPL